MPYWVFIHLQGKTGSNEWKNLRKGEKFQFLFHGFSSPWRCCIGFSSVFIVSKSNFPSSKLLVQEKWWEKTKYISFRTNVILLLAKSRCPFRSSCVTLWQNEWEEERAGKVQEHSWNLYRPGRRAGCFTQVVKWDGKHECWNQSLFPAGSGAPPPRLGVVLLPCSVDVMEERHGERHAQQLHRKQEGNGNKSLPVGFIDENRYLLTLIKTHKCFS